MQLNLLASHCTELGFLAQFRLTPAQVQAIEELFVTAGDDPDWPWLVAEPFRSGRQPFTYEIGLEPAEQLGLFDFDLHVYVTEEDGEEPTPVSPEQLLGLLGTFQISTTGLGTGHFAYARRHGASAIPLPIIVAPAAPAVQPLLALPAALADRRVEVHGLHLLVQGTTEEDSFSIILDQTPEGDVLHVVTFACSLAIQSELPAQVLERASGFSRLLLRAANEPGQGRRSGSRGQRAPRPGQQEPRRIDPRQSC